nr:hypothetical protein MmNV_55 [Menippe mercenaria nudivirus]
MAENTWNCETVVASEVDQLSILEAGFGGNTTTIEDWSVETEATMPVMPIPNSKESNAIVFPFIKSIMNHRGGLKVVISDFDNIKDVTLIDMFSKLLCRMPPDLYTIIMRVESNHFDLFIQTKIDANWREPLQSLQQYLTACLALIKAPYKSIRVLSGPQDMAAVLEEITSQSIVSVYGNQDVANYVKCYKTQNLYEMNPYYGGNDFGVIPRTPYIYGRVPKN